MTTRQSNQRPSSPERLLGRLDRAMEIVWLAAIALVPLAVLSSNDVLVGAEVPKVFLLRTVAIVLGLLTLVRWWIDWAVLRDMKDPVSELLRLTAWMRSSAARLIGIGGLAVLVVTAFGTLLSPVPPVSMWGVDIGFDTFALANTASFVVLFGVMAARLRGEQAVYKVLWTIAGSATLIALVGVAQALFGAAGEAGRRIGIEATFGNPVFAGSYFAITIPVTLGLILAGKMRTLAFPDWLVGGIVLLPQIVAAGLTGTRGSFLALAVALLVILAVSGWAAGRASALNVARIVAVPLGVIVLVMAAGLLAPADSDLNKIAKRYVRLPSQLDQLTGSANIRMGIWERSIDVWLDPRWVDSDRFHELPALSVEPLRPLIGYGPDVFRYAYLLSDEEANAGLALHAHSFVLHTAVELGVLGLLAYGLLAGATGFALVRIVRNSRGAPPTPTSLLSIALLGALVARLVEQIPGKAQASDLMLSWALAAVVVALVFAVRGAGEEHEQRAPAAAADKVLTLGQVLPVVLVVFGFAVLWWEAVFSPVVSIRQNANALHSAARGEIAEAVDNYESAMAWSPGVAVNYIGLTSYMTSGLRFEDLGFVSLADALAGADALIIQVLERNALDYRAWDFRRAIFEELDFFEKIDPSVLPRTIAIQAELNRLPERPSTPQR